MPQPASDLFCPLFCRHVSSNLDVIDFSAFFFILSFCCIVQDADLLFSAPEFESTEEEPLQKTDKQYGLKLMKNDKGGYQDPAPRSLFPSVAPMTFVCHRSCDGDPDVRNFEVAAGEAKGPSKTPLLLRNRPPGLYVLPSYFSPSHVYFYTHVHICICRQTLFLLFALDIRTVMSRLSSPIRPSLTVPSTFYSPALSCYSSSLD